MRTLKQNAHLFTTQISHDSNHMFPNLRHNLLQTEEDWCKWWTKMAANLNIFKNSYKNGVLSKSKNF